MTPAQLARQKQKLRRIHSRLWQDSYGEMNDLLRWRDRAVSAVLACMPNAGRIDVENPPAGLDQAALDILAERAPLFAKLRVTRGKLQQNRAERKALSSTQ